MEKKEKLAIYFMPIILRRYRDKAGLSQQELADKIGVSKGFISALEGGRSVPNLDRLLQIAEAFGLMPGALVDDLLKEIRKSMVSPHWSINPKPKQTADI